MLFKANKIITMHFVKFANKITRNNFLDRKYVRAVKFYKTPYQSLHIEQHFLS